MFATGKRPSGEDYADLIESFANLLELEESPFEVWAPAPFTSTGNGNTPELVTRFPLPTWADLRTVRAAGVASSGILVELTDYGRTRTYWSGLLTASGNIATLPPVALASPISGELLELWLSVPDLSTLEFYGIQFFMHH